MSTAFYDVDALAERWGRNKEWIRRAANAGDIPGTRIGRLWRFDPDAIHAYEQRHTNRDPLSMTPLAAARARRKKS